MSYEHRIPVDTPEGVRLDVRVAGLGSRLTAAAVDGTIQVLVGGALLLAVVAVAGMPAMPLAVPTIVTVVLLGYDIPFEVRRSGRTPGKAAAGVRVVQVDGSPVTLRASAVRNLLRLVDILPGVYGVGAVAVVLSPRSQRLGDLAAGTLVVREAGAGARREPDPLPALLTDELDSWDTTGVGEAEVVAVARFLERREGLRPDARRRLAGDLATRLRPTVVAPSAHHDDELFLRQLLAARRARLERQR